MISHIISFENLYKVLLNTISVSLPEEIFLVMFTFLLIGEFDILEDYKKVVFDSWDYKRVLIPAIITSLVSNLLRYSGVNYVVHFLVFFFTMYICIVFMGDLLNDSMISVLRWMGRALIGLVLGGIIIFTAELSYGPLILQITKDSVIDINNNMLLNFVCSLPARLIEYSILAAIIAKKSTNIRINYFRLIFKSKFLTSIFVGMLTVNFFYMVVMIKLIAYDKALSSLMFHFQFMIIIASCLFPFLNIGAFMWTVYYISNRENAHINKTAKQLCIFLQCIKSYTNNGKYDNISWEMNNIVKRTEEIYNLLQNDN